MSSDFGMKNVVIRNIKSAIRKGRFKTQEELSSAIKDAVDSLNEEKESFDKLLRLRLSCSHEEWSSPRYSVRKRVIGYVTVYERTCKNCGYVESFIENDENTKDKPSWTQNAKEVYYNNNI